MTWRGSLGEQVVPGAVLAGVYDLICLENGQRQGVHLFWQHDLTSGVEFLGAATHR